MRNMKRIVMSCLVSLVWFFGLYSSYISETIEDQSFAMGKAMERVRFLFLNAAFHAAFLCVCLAFGSNHFQCFFPCTLVQLTPLMKQDLAAWSDGVRGDLQHIAILNDAQICGLTQLIWQYNDMWTFPFWTINQGLYHHVTVLKQRRSSPNASKEASPGGSASIGLGNRFECSLYAICMPFVLIDYHISHTRFSSWCYVVGLNDSAWAFIILSMFCSKIWRSWCSDVLFARFYFSKS